MNMATLGMWDAWCISTIEDIKLKTMEIYWVGRQVSRSVQKGKILSIGSVMGDVKIV